MDKDNKNKLKDLENKFNTLDKDNKDNLKKINDFEIKIRSVNDDKDNQKKINDSENKYNNMDKDNKKLSDIEHKFNF